MSPALPRLLAPTLLVACACVLRAADAAPRSAPSRPGAPPPAEVPSLSAAPALLVKKIRGVDYVGVAEFAARLGFKSAVSDRGRKVRLSGRSTQVDLEADARDAAVGGLRVVLGEPVLLAGGLLHVSRTDAERALTPLLRPGFGVAPRAAPRTVVLDPGHGGKDPGTSAHEKTYALDVARRAKPLLEAAGLRVVLTRDADVALELGERTDIANARRADLFVSIHFNAVPRDTTTSGVQVFTFAPAGQHAAEWWNTPMRGADPHLEKNEMPVNRHDHWSVLLAHGLHRRLVADLRATDRGRKIAHWGVLRGLDCPGVLVECGFLTSTAEAKKIATPAYRQQIAAALAAGIRDYAAAVAAAQPRPPGAAVAKNAD